MKITVNVECTPEEARAYMGLPDMRPLHEAFVGELQNRMSEQMRMLDPAAVMQVWQNPGAAGAGAGPAALEQMQKLFWAGWENSLSQANALSRAWTGQK